MARTPGARPGGLAILVPMKRLREAMDAFHGYANTVDGTLPKILRGK
jgi:hypothetical protein